MTLAQDFVEPLDDLSQWTLLGSVGGDPFIVSNTLMFPVATGEHANRRIIMNDFYTLQDSYFTFRVKAVGHYPQVIAQAGVGGALNTFFLNDYPGQEGQFTMIVGGVDVVSLPDGETPYIAIYSDGTDVHFAYSTNIGADWTVVRTVTMLAIDPDGTGLAKLILGETAFGGAASDYDQQFDRINAIPAPGFGDAPELTEVDADPLVLAWNVIGTVNKSLDVNWNIDVGYLRHSTRHLHRTVYDYLNTELTALGWTVADSVPFNAPVVRMQETLPDEWDQASVLEPGTVAVTLGDENATQGQELGGPLGLIEVPIFIDCFMDTDSTALALALDVRDIFTGRIGTARRYKPVNNYNVTPEVEATGYSVEFDDVVRDRVKNKWHVVKLTAQMYFPDSEGN